MKRIAICVPSYGHRYKELISNLHNININDDQHQYDKYIFVSNNDETKLEYESYKSDNVSVIYVDANNLPSKRQAILDFCINNNYDYMFMIDDDVKYSAKYISEETKRETSNSYRSYRTDIDILFKEAVKLAEENNAGHVSFTLPFYIGFKKPNEIVKNKSLNAGQFILLDIKQIVENNIHYDITFFSTEDISLLLDCLISGINCMAINYMSYELCNDNFFRDNKNDTSAAFENMWDRYKTMFGDNYKYNIPISIDKRKVLHRRIKFEKYFNANKMPSFKNAYDENVHNMIVEYYNTHQKFDNEIISNVINYLWGIYEERHTKK